MDYKSDEQSLYLLTDSHTLARHWQRPSVHARRNPEKERRDPPRASTPPVRISFLVLAPGAEDGTASDANAGRIAAAGSRTHT
jgi:hypothetical protein